MEESASEQHRKRVAKAAKEREEAQRQAEYDEAHRREMDALRGRRSASHATGAPATNPLGHWNKKNQ